MTGPRIDHVIIGARKLADARELLWDRYGFGITDGTSNGDGTDSWLIPFDSPLVQYLELIVVTDEPALRSSQFGQTFLDRTVDGPAFVGWAVAVDDIGQAAERLQRLTGEDPELLHGESIRADGQRMPWSEAAFAAAWAVPSRPFFLSYGEWAARSARKAADLAAAGHRCTPMAITRLTVGTGRGDLTDWLGGPQPFLAAHPAPYEAVESVLVTTVDGPVEIRLTPFWER
jgi:hypothetical protein